MSAPDSVVTESVVRFLSSIPPFQFVPQHELSKVARSITLEYFPKDTVILRAGQRATESLYVIQKGGVKLALRTQVGKELILDMRSEGEVFGLLSLMGGQIARLDATAIEDTLCYTVPGSEMQRLVEDYPQVSDFFMRTSVRRYVDRTLGELQSQSQLMGNAERLLYSLKVSDVQANPVVTCFEITSIRETAQLIARSHSTCVIVIGTDGSPVGIVTDRDFTTKVLANALSTDHPVSRIMSAPVITVDRNALLFQALLEMLTHHIQHVLVTENGKPHSVLTTHDIALLQGRSPLTVVRHLAQQNDVASLGEAQKRITGLLPLLLREGAKASHITRVIAEINDHVIGRIFELAHAELGPAPVPYCWVVLGSEGRREQTFKTDQDNALIYDDSADRDAEQYFARLTEFVRDALEKCGYPPCTGGYMASNPQWRMSLSSWKQSFTVWIADAKRRATEDALILFDMRPVTGDRKLFEDLSHHNRGLLKDATFFKSILAFISIVQKPPLGFFRQFVVERSGEHREELDLKMLGTGLIVNAARLFALDNGVESTNTLDRLIALRALEYLDPALLNDLEQAFEFLSLLRLEQQIELMKQGLQPSSYIRPEKLTHLQRSLLKETFQAIGRAQNFIDHRFASAVWQQMER